MEIKGTCSFYPETIVFSKHFCERNDRMKKAEEIGVGNITGRFLVNKGHKNGEEVHCVTDTGLVFIFNKESHCFVTVLIARPSQISRYYKSVSIPAPSDILRKAGIHEKQHLNR